MPTETYAHRIPSPEAKVQMDSLRRQFAELHDTINASTEVGVLSAHYEPVKTHITDGIPNGREKSLALTNLEQSSMWANKAGFSKDAERARLKALALTSLEQAAMWANKAIVVADPNSEVIK